MKKNTPQPQVEKTKGADNSVDEGSLKKELGDQYEASFNSMQTIRQTWDAKEAMLVSKTTDSISGTTKSQVNDPRLATIAIERASRVMAQLPSGKVQTLSMEDEGKNQMMNLIKDKYIMPNANAQFDLLIKYRMWDIYSQVYGSMPMLVDYRISDDYIGPDCYLIPMRSFLPQAGRISIKELDHCFIDTEVTVGWLKKRNKGTWKNLDSIIKKAAEGGANQGENDNNKRSYVQRNQYPYIPSAKGDSAIVRLSTRYQVDRWVTFAPDFDDVDGSNVIRDIANPQKNNRIPIVMKHCFPLLDSIIGLGEFERGKTLQYAINSLVNLYMDGVKMSIFPPIMIDPTGVVPSTIRFNPAEKWLVTKPGSINPFRSDPQGINTFQSTYSFLVAAMLNMAGTTDTTTTSKTDPGLGKTPEALSMLSQRESARDNWDRYMMEKAVEEVTDIMVDMVATKQEKPIKFGLFGDEIKQIQKDSPALGDWLKISKSGRYAQATIKQTDINDTKYKFFIDSGTSMQQDNESMNQIAQGLLVTVLKNPQITQALAQSQTPRKIDVAELVEVMVNTSGLPNASKIIIDMTPDEIKQMQAAQQGQNPQQQNPVREMIQMRDLPPVEAAQMAQQAGIHANPQDFAGMKTQSSQPAQMPQQPGIVPGQPSPQMMPPGMPQQNQPQNQPQLMRPNFKDPHIAQLAEHFQLGGHANG